MWGGGGGVWGGGCGVFFFFNDPATTEIYTLSLHDALPILRRQRKSRTECGKREQNGGTKRGHAGRIVSCSMTEALPQCQR